VRRIHLSPLIISLFFGGATLIVADDSRREVTELDKPTPAIHGSVVILKEAMTNNTSVNLGGLVVVLIPDSQSHPPQEIAVHASSPQATFLGHVRGARSTDDGQTLFGGGYTWYLFRASELTKNLQIDVSYIPNGNQTPTRIHRTHQIEIQSE